MLCRYLSSACVSLVSRLLRVWLSANPVLLVIGLARRLGCGPLLPWVRPSRVRPSCPGRRPEPVASSSSSAGVWLGMSRGGGTKSVYGASAATGAAGSRPRAGAAVGRFPDTGQPGDNRGAAAVDDQGEPGDTLDHGSVSRGAAARAAPRPTALVRHPPGNRGRLHQLAREPAASILLACVTR